jgi:hypothetical protein
VRGRWVRPYLGYYLRLVEEDQRSVLENSPVLCVEINSRKLSIPEHEGEGQGAKVWKMREGQQ